MHGQNHIKSGITLGFLTFNLLHLSEYLVAYKRATDYARYSVTV